MYTPKTPLNAKQGPYRAMTNAIGLFKDNPTDYHLACAALAAHEKEPRRVPAILSLMSPQGWNMMSKHLRLPQIPSPRVMPDPVALDTLKELLDIARSQIETDREKLELMKRQEARAARAEIEAEMNPKPVSSSLEKKVEDDDLESPEGTKKPAKAGRSSKKESPSSVQGGLF